MPADLIELYFWLQLIADLILVGFGIYHEIVLERMKSEINRLRKVTINLDLDRVAAEDKIGKLQKNYKRIISTATGANISLVIKKKQNKYSVHVYAIGDKEYVLMALERAIEALGGTDND